MATGNQHKHLLPCVADVSLLTLRSRIIKLRRIHRRSRRNVPILISYIRLILRYIYGFILPKTARLKLIQRIYLTSAPASHRKKRLNLRF